MEEMMEETIDAVDDEEIEQEADEEVEKVLYELTDGKLGQAGRVNTELPVCMSNLINHQAQEEEEDEAEMQRMRKEMQDLLTS
jgi:charged multivesicular body protein 3